MRPRLYFFRALIFTMASAALVAQRATPTTIVTEDNARALAQEAVSVIKPGNQKDFDKAFQERIRRIVPNYKSGGATLLSGPLSVTIFSRLAAFQSRAGERVRKLESITTTPWPADEVVVYVISTRLTDPLVEKIVVNRNGIIIEPTASDIQEHQAKNLLGASMTVRDGWAAFPASAFAPDRKLDLRIMIIPVSGRNQVSRVTTLALSHAAFGN